MTITITEGLAEIKLVASKIEKKRQFIKTYLARQNGIRDPLEKEGGSRNAIEAAMQSVVDLEERLILLREAISNANANNNITISGEVRTIFQWLIWRKEVAPVKLAFLQNLLETLNKVRKEAIQKEVKVSIEGSENPLDIVVNLKEGELSKEIEKFQDILGHLDGQLSLKNATILLTI